jgi:hypothetical protein
MEMRYDEKGCSVYQPELKPTDTLRLENTEISFQGLPWDLRGIGIEI